MRRIIFAVLFSICIGSSISAIQVSGDVWGVWTADDNPYEVTGDLRVPQESTLVIQPGCYINFQGHYLFLIDTSAVFQAVGTETDSITFTASDTTDGWYGLRFFSAHDSCELSYSIIEYGKILEHNQDSYFNGGGIFIKDTDISISNCIIRNNVAWEGEGAGIYCYNSTISIFNNIIIDNHAAWGGAGIMCYLSEITIEGNIIEGNSSYYPLGGEWHGGGIGCLNSTLIISNNRISNNFCGQVGGGILLKRCNAIITNNEILENMSWDTGGGILIDDSSSVIIDHNTIAYNIGEIWAGGGIYCRRSHLFSTNNTICYNTANAIGGGLYLSEGINDSLVNNIIWNNIAANSPQLCVIDETLTALYNNIQDTLWPGEGNINADPLFVDPENGNFHLSWANYPIDDETKSPCIDTGAPWSPFDPDSTRADMGAYPFDQSINNIDIEPFLPESYALSQNYPNPFNASTTISYTLPCQSDVTIDIYDILGRKVQTLVSRNQPAGYHRVIWNADELTSGIYFYKLKASDYIETKKMMLLK